MSAHCSRGYYCIWLFIDVMNEGICITVSCLFQIKLIQNAINCLIVHCETNINVEEAKQLKNLRIHNTHNSTQECEYTYYNYILFLLK